MNNLKENCILGIYFLSQNYVKINTKNKQLNYDDAAAEQLLKTDCAIYSLTIGDDQTEIPLMPYNKSHVNKVQLEIPDRLLANDNTYITYESQMVFNKKGPDYKRPTVITETYYEGPLSANDLLDLLPFQQLTINDDEIISIVPVSEFDLSHLEPDQRRIVIRQLYEFENENVFSNKEGNLGLAVHVKHFLNTGDSLPVSMRSRRTPVALKSKVWEQLRTMLAKKVKRISSSP
jgi:hypothetical protein